VSDPTAEDSDEAGAADPDEAGAADPDEAGAADQGDGSAAAGNDDADAAGWTPAWLAALRADDSRRWVALVAAALAGVGLATVHWLGLFVAGALVGLVSETVPRAAAAGLAVGVAVLAVHVGASPVMSPGEFLALTPAAYVTVAAALAAPLWGSLVRGVV